MLWLCQLKSQTRELSITFANIGGYMIDCQKVADDRIDLRPKIRKRKVGLRSFHQKDI